ERWRSGEWQMDWIGRRLRWPRICVGIGAYAWVADGNVMEMEVDRGCFRRVE
ncbi:hypothetical protein PIB30_112823, partial [Stylosanthes scabra]|nr:hypothetical protein [Stylosanthes scabra]